MKKELQELLEYSKIELIEKKENSEYLGTIRFKFAEAEKTNKNKRVYSQKVLDSAIEKLRSKDKAVLGQSGHPKDGATVLDSVSHVLDKIERNGKNYFAEAKLLNTTSGKNIKILSKVTSIGASMRGRGELQRNEDGVHEVKDGYELHSIDLVLDPSFKDARLVTESDAKRILNPTEASEKQKELKERIRNDMKPKGRIKNPDFNEEYISDESAYRQFDEAVRSCYQGSLVEFKENVLKKKK